jgi:hypothetical protein
MCFSNGGWNGSDKLSWVIHPEERISPFGDHLWLITPQVPAIQAKNDPKNHVNLLPLSCV